MMVIILVLLNMERSKDKYFMKILFVLSCLLIMEGCASIEKIYRQDNQTSKNQLIKEFNIFAKGKSLQIMLRNGASIFSLADTYIFDDSLYTDTSITKEKKIINRKDIKKLEIYGTEYGAQSASLILNQGEVINADDIRFLSGSEIEISITNIYKRIMPLDSVYEISFKNRILGLIPGILSGGAIGAATGLLIGFSISSKENADAYLALPIGGAVGGLAGGIIGYINGYNYIYKFSP